MLTTIPIYPELIQPNPKWMLDKNDNVDLMGQILMGLQVKVHRQIESPAHQGTLIHPFTVKVRNRSHNTEITLQLLRNAENLSPRKQVEEANSLLEGYNLYLEIQE